ncbi:hypothetical protein ACFYKX_10290 [Cytobacillus sp. FJAT-54145]|uniref:Uncharacterized protein n=1 Tax=Cytobacillus spartinae TaxID=3299023 RepID=A0ABW6KA18_9BACI
MVLATPVFLLGADPTEAAGFMEGAKNVVESLKGDWLHWVEGMKEGYRHLNELAKMKLAPDLQEADQVTNWFIQMNEKAKEELANPKSDTKRLMIWVFSIISKVIYTPAFLFDNVFFKGMLLKFSALAGGMVGLLAMGEGLKRILGFKGSGIKEILGRFPLMMAVCGFAPFLFVKAIEGLNAATRFIFLMGNGMLQDASSTSGSWALDGLDSGTFLIFNGLFVLLLVPFLLNHGRRWFQLLSLGILTPFAMLGFVFDSLRGFQQKWWTSMRDLYVVQLVYGVFVTLLSLIMFGMPFPMTPSGMFAKCLVTLGGLYSLAFPPSFVKNMLEKETKTDRKVMDALKAAGRMAILKR